MTRLMAWRYYLLGVHIGEGVHLETTKIFDLGCTTTLTTRKVVGSIVEVIAYWIAIVEVIVHWIVVTSRGYHMLVKGCSWKQPTL